MLVCVKGGREHAEVSVFMPVIHAASIKPIDNTRILIPASIEADFSSGPQG
jgi:hypothetical protein